MCGEQSVALSEGQSAGLCADQSAALTCRPISSQPASLKLQGVPSVAVEALLDVFVCLEKTNYSTKEYTLPYTLSYVQIKKIKEIKMKIIYEVLKQNKLCKSFSIIA